MIYIDTEAVVAAVADELETVDPNWVRQDLEGEWDEG